MRVVLFLLVSLWIFPAFAQSLRKPPKVDFTYNKYSPFLTGPRYEDLVKRILSGQRDGFSFELLRIYYSTVEVYDPNGETAIDDLLNTSYKISKTKDSIEKEAALLDYRAVLYAHLGNMGVVEQALSLALEDPVYGDADMLAWLLGGLRDSVLVSGDGQDLSSAYVVYGGAEEQFILKHLQAEVLETERVSKGRKYYNIYFIATPKAVEPYYLVIDVSQPAQYLEAQKRNRFQ